MRQIRLLLDGLTVIVCVRHLIKPILLFYITFYSPFWYSVFHSLDFVFCFNWLAQDFALAGTTMDADGNLWAAMVCYCLKFTCSQPSWFASTVFECLNCFLVGRLRCAALRFNDWKMHSVINFAYLCSYSYLFSRFIKVAAKQVTSCAFGGPNLVSLRIHIRNLRLNNQSTCLVQWKWVIEIF